MKAKEYFAKYEQDLVSENTDKCSTAIAGLLTDMNAEVKKLMEVRHAKFDRGGFAVLKEMNEKWNALVRLFEKKYGVTPIIRDGFRTWWIHERPQLQDYI